MKKIWNKIKCYFLGHSHPWFTCAYCGKSSQLMFYRDENGLVVRDKNGNPLVVSKR